MRQEWMVHLQWVRRPLFKGFAILETALTWATGLRSWVQRRWHTTLGPQTHYFGLNARIIVAQLMALCRVRRGGGKNDGNDAAGVCKAASRPNMHFVAVKTHVRKIGVFAQKSRTVHWSCELCWPQHRLSPICGF